MEELRAAILQIMDIYDEIAQLLSTHLLETNSATHDMLKNAVSVSKYAKQLVSKTEFSDNELNLMLGVTRSFSRHLSEVEQTVYEEIGNEGFDKLTFLISKGLPFYNFIWDYLRGNQVS